MSVLKIFLSSLNLDSVHDDPCPCLQGGQAVIIELSRHYNSIYPANISPAKTIQTQSFLLDFSNKLYMYK